MKQHRAIAPNTIPSWQKNLPAPVRFFLRPWLLLALMLHGVVLWLPLLPENEPLEPEPEPESVSLTPLPLPPEEEPIVLPPSPAPTPPPTPVAPPPQAIAPAPQVQPQPQQLVIPQNPEPTQAPTPMPSPEPAVSPSPTATDPSPSPDPVTSPSPTATPPETPWADFPHVEGATAGCGGRDGCWQTDGDEGWRNVRDTVTATLLAEGYALRNVTSELRIDSDFADAFAVERDSEVAYYLYFVSNLDGARYIMEEEPLTAEELRALRR